MVCAKFYKRALAHVIDITLIIMMVQVPVEFMLNNSDISSSSSVLLKGITELCLLLLTLFFWIRYKGTPGKILMKVIVVSENGSTMSWSQSVWRYFAYLVSVIPLGAGFIWALFDKKGRCWHDIISKTMVIDNNNS